MEQWEAVLESYQEPPDVRVFSKLLQVAGNVLKLDLADFEIDWFLLTLRYEPISLLNTIRWKKSDDTWSKPIGDGFKLLTELVEKVPRRVEPWIEDIVQTCEIPLDARSRVYALGCLTACVKRRGLDARKYIAALQETSACKAPMAVLVGTICEYHPEIVADDATNIWRIYLNLLDSNKNTDSVINAVLQGISGIFKHFGMDLPVVELTKFYQKLSREYIKISKCENVVLSILQNYTGLFKQVLSRDFALRMYIWTPDFVRVATSIYKTVATELNREEIQNILTNEILPQTTNSNASIKYTALRICDELKKQYNLQTGTFDLDVYTLEFEMRNEVSYYASEAISFCIDCNLPNSEKVLQSAILFYANLPSNKRKEIVVNGVLKADNELMMATLNYMITESCQPDALPSLLPVWKDILQSDLSRKMTFFINYMKNFIFVLDMFLEGDEKNIPEKLTNFLILTYHVLILTPPEEQTADQCALVSRKIAQLGAEYGVNVPSVGVVRGLMCHVEGDDGLMGVYEMFEIERCKDEALLCEMSLALIHAPKKYNNFDRILLALEVIFSRKDAEPTTLAQALKKLEDVIVTAEHMDDGRIFNIIKLVEKLRNRKDLTGKEARILQRDVTLFLGKYSMNDINNNCNFDTNFAIDLKEKLTLDLPTSYGDVYKINLSRQVILAIEEENYEMLNILLCVLCTNPSIETEPYQKALGAIIARCGRGDDHAGVVRSQMYCGVHTMDYVVELLTHLTPGTRKLLCDVIEGILLKDSRNSELITKVADNVLTLLSSSLLTHRQAGLDLLQSLFQPLKENNEVTQKLLLRLLILVTTTNETDTFLLIDEIQKLLKEKIELFESDTLKTTLNIVLLNLLKITSNNLIAHKNYTNLVKSGCELVKIVCEAKCLDIWTVVGSIFDSCQNDSDRYLKMAAELAGKFVGLVSNEFLEMNNGFLVKNLFDFDGDLNEYQLDNVLLFLNTFVSVLLEFHKQQTKLYINNLIKNLKPNQVIILRKKLSILLTKYKEIVDIKSLIVWLEKQPLDDFSNALEANQIGGHLETGGHVESLTAVRILLETFKVENPSVILTFLNESARKWPRMVLKMFSAGFLNYVTVGLTFLTDVLAVSLKFLTVTDLKKLVLEGHSLRGVKNERLGLEFCKFFIEVFYEYFLRKPFVLLDDDMSECCVILNDIVKIVVRKRSERHYEDLFDLIEHLWPKYAVRTEFAQKQKLLLDLSFLNKKLSTCSKPILWAMSVIEDENADINEKILLVGVLPGGEGCSDVYRKYASVLPTRLSELRGTNHSVLRSLLDATAIHTDSTLLDIVITRAAGDPTPGWWDSAFSSCMASAAMSSNEEVFKVIYERSWEGVSVSVCVRLLVPFIRYSTPTKVTTFISNKLQELIKKLRHQKSPANHYLYHKYVADSVRVLNIFLAVIEKIPPQHLESPTSPLYANTQTDKPWHLVRELCKLCVTLRDKVQPPGGASQELAALCRTFQTTAYNCLCACITVWKPDEKLYNTIYDLNAWEKVSNSNEEYKLPIRAQWNTTSISLTTSVRSSSACTSVRTRLFLRTLSENPLLYDLIDDFDEEQVETQQILLPSTELNSHPCAPTITSLFLHSTERNHTAWLNAVDTALREGSTNCRWLLAQAICNTKEELTNLAVSLAPGLLATIADTAVSSDGRKLLNGLHIDIINTLIQWGDVPNPNLTHTNICTEYLIHTCVSNRDRKSVYRSLLDVFNKYLDVFGKYISLKWSVFENYVDDPAIAKSTIPILTKIAKSNIHIPELLPVLISKLSNYHDNQLAKMAELLGLVIKNDPSRSEAAVKKLFDKFRKSSLNDYVKLVYYSKYCDEQQFRIIVDLTQKLPPSEKKKCIDIIHAYLVEHPGSDLVEELPSEVRSLVDEKSGGKRFEEFFAPTSEPQSKRPRLQTPSLILNTIGNNERYFNKLLNDLDGTNRGQLLEKLSKDMGVRLPECFYIYIYLPIIYTNNKIPDLSVCLSSFYENLFHHLKSDDKFKQAKLLEKSVELDKGQVSKILTRTKTYVGSLRSYSYKTSRQIKKETKSGFGSEIFVEKVLDTLIQFAKVSVEASMDLLKQLFLSIKSNQFDSFPVMADMLSKIIVKETTFLDFSRVFAQDLCEIDGIFDTIEELKTKTLGTDVEFLVKILYKDLKLRKMGPEQFILGTPINADISDVLMRHDNEQFSIEALVSTFQKLSNWDDLTLQERHKMESTGIPKLWTDRDNFDGLLQDYTETVSWFGKMVSLSRNKKQNSLKWLREAERPPRRFFEMSAIIEGIQWHDDVHTKHYDCSINNKDCTAEWAARLMIRSAHISKTSDERDGNALSRSHELTWCKRASEMALPQLALQCIQRNTRDLYENETLTWLEQKVDALKLMGLKQDDSQLLRKALDTADKYTPLFEENSTPEVIVKMKSLIVELSSKLEILNPKKLETVSDEIEIQFDQLDKRSVMSFEMKKRLQDFYSTSIVFYDDLYNGGPDISLKNTYLKSIILIIQRSIDLNLDLKEGFLAILFNTMDSFQNLDTEVVDSLEKLVKSFLKTKPTQFLYLLKTKLCNYPLGLFTQEATVKKYTTCLQLIADPDFTLLRYCTEMIVAVRNGDNNEYKKLFNRMKLKIFENNYLGTDYQPLMKYKRQLYEIENMSNSAETQTVLKSIIKELEDKRPISTLRLSQLCPALTDLDEDNDLKQLLGLDEDVIKFEDQIQVYTDSIGRPCVLTAILKNGRKSRFLVKQADMWRAAAALTVAGSYPVGYEGYRIIPLSEDCGLIEFLENHVRLRELISKTFDLNEISIKRQSTKEDELILPPIQTSVASYNQICNKIPCYLLRSAIETKCISVQDFFNKKNKYVNTLCTMTIFNYIFGLGDRHLENILYDLQNGGLQCIDLDAFFQYGFCELPPARLTRNILSLVDGKVLESRLQSKMTAVRDCQRFLTAVMTFCFQSDDQDFVEKFPYIKATLNGTKLSHEITKDVIKNFEKRYKDKYIKLLDEIFKDFEKKNQYNIEEQVSSLLLHCTDPRILSIVRSGWEPWI